MTQQICLQFIMCIYYSLFLILYYLNSMETIDEHIQQQVQKIAKKAYNEQIQSLHLYQIGPIWMDVLSYKKWSFLHYLSVFDCGVNDSNIKFICSFDWANLTNLSLERNNITQDGVKQLMGKDWPNLVSLDFFNNQIGNNAVQIVLQKVGEQLKQLKISTCGVDSLGLLPFLNKKLNFVTLNISRNLIGSKGVKILTKIDMPLLQILLICNCEIGNEGLKFLSNGRWNNLKRLYAECTKMSLISYDYVFQLNCKNLTDLWTHQKNAMSMLSLVLMQANHKSKKVIVTAKINNQKISKQIQGIFDRRKIQLCD